MSSIASLDTDSEGRTHKYGASSWLFFTVSTFFSVSFMALHVIITGVRSGAIDSTTIDAIFPYVLVAQTAVISMILSAICVGLTISLIVVRCLLHRLPCGLYSMFLIFQSVPWVYFFVVVIV